MKMYKVGWAGGEASRSSTWRVYASHKLGGSGKLAYLLGDSQCHAAGTQAKLVSHQHTSVELQTMISQSRRRMLLGPSHG